nr:TrbC/VirB2 family protein [Pararhodobacter sp.]
MTSKNLQSVLRARAVVALGATALIVLAGPALAQSIDLSPVQTLLQGIVDAITGPLGIVIGTLALIGVFLSWLFGILDFRQALWVVVAIAGIAAAPTIVAAIWTT